MHVWNHFLSFGKYCLGVTCTVSKSYFIFRRTTLDVCEVKDDFRGESCQDWGLW